MIDYFVKMTSSHLKRMEIVKDEPEINHRRTTVPGSYRTGDSFAGRRVVTIGGGSGTFSVLSHLKKYPFNITAIVTMSDSGGSSRMLMDEFHRQLPLGDLRQSLVALARNGALWREVFMHRFERPDAEKVYVCNLMTKPGETDGYKASDFVNEIHRYLGGSVDRVIINDGPFPADLLKMYAEERSEPVIADRAPLTRLVPNVTIEHLNLEDDRLARL